MRHYSDSEFQLRFSGLVVIYALLVAFELPYAATVSNMPGKIILIVLPVLPMAFAIALWGRQVALSDELTQRTHLIALGIAAGVVSVASVIAALLLTFLSVKVSGAILFWVLPALWVMYGVLRKWMRRQHRNRG